MEIHPRYTNSQTGKDILTPRRNTRAPSSGGAFILRYSTGQKSQEGSCSYAPEIVVGKKSLAEGLC